MEEVHGHVFDDGPVLGGLASPDTRIIVVEDHVEDLGSAGLDERQRAIAAPRPWPRRRALPRSAMWCVP